MSVSRGRLLSKSLRVENVRGYRCPKIPNQQHQSLKLSKRMKGTTKAHYEGHSADSYEGAFFYEAGAYTEHLCALVKDCLQLTQAAKPKRMLDIGGGTGNFTRMLVKDTKVTAVVVDPFLEKGKGDIDGVSFVAEPAESFMKDPSTDQEKGWRNNYDYVLLKEVAHHFADQDRLPIFRGMCQGLRPSDGPPSLLLITRPQIDIDYPLWDAARKVWQENQPSLDKFVAELRDAGFTEIQHTISPYPCAIALDRWQSMIKARFWSTFSNFSDDQLAEACKRIAEDEKHRIKDGVIEFEDRLLFITAKKV